MRTRMGVCFVLAALLAVGFLGFRHSEATPQLMTAAADSVPNELLVKFKPATAETAVIQAIEAVQGAIIAHRGEVVSAGLWAENKSEYRSFLGDPDLFHVKLPPILRTEKAIAELLANPNVEFAEKNYVSHIETIPNDPEFSYQWGLHNTGQSGGTADADIDAPEAWEIFTGSSDITIAVIDTGIDYGHTDLQSNIWTNPGEIGGGKETDGIDNDGNGKIDDWHGWDFVNSDNNPMDDNSHGTHVAGIAGASGNNETNVAGVCWNVKLMPVKAYDAYGYGNTARDIAAIDYAISLDAQVINASWGSYSYSAALYQAIERAMTSGILFVAAAGNDSYNNNTTPLYPSSYDIDNIISVLATTDTDTLSAFSNYGSYSVDLGAPGGEDATQNGYNILSTIPNNQTSKKAGTSMATPFVSGGSALVLGQRPTIDWWQAKTIILKSVDTKSALVGKARTHGRLNVLNVLNYSTPVLPDAPTDLEGAAFENGDFYDIQLTWTDNSNNESGFNIYLKSGPGVFNQLGSTGPNVTTFWLTEVGSGYWYFYVRAFTADGESTKTQTVSVKAY
ncbi:MAG: S8 family serine peptidase [Candidatus Aminicenantes bacterium]|nr:S8 family serine peptidase [Candidatus Aminicenantes bacterium]